MPECLRKSKGEIREDLVNCYEALGKPGKGKPLKVLVQEVEEEFSKNLEFSVQKVGKTLWLHCRKDKVELPSDRAWKTKVFKEPKTEIPYVTDGQVSIRCLKFFQDVEGEDVEIRSEGDKSSSVNPAMVPLPGAKTTPASVSGGGGQVLHKGHSKWFQKFPV